MYFLTSQDNSASRVFLRFTSTPQYWIFSCGTSYTNFPTSVPAADDKVWRITKIPTSGIRLQIHCNGVRVLNILMSDSTCSSSSWSTAWSQDVEKMYFNQRDTASDFYKSPEGNYTAQSALLIYRVCYPL